MHFTLGPSAVKMSKEIHPFVTHDRVQYKCSQGTDTDWKKMCTSRTEMDEHQVLLQGISVRTDPQLYFVYQSVL